MAKPKTSTPAAPAAPPAPKVKNYAVSLSFATPLQVQGSTQNDAVVAMLQQLLADVQAIKGALGADKLEALRDQLKYSAEALQAAVQANQPK